MPGRLALRCLAHSYKLQIWRINLRILLQEIMMRREPRRPALERDAIERTVRQRISASRNQAFEIRFWEILEHRARRLVSKYIHGGKPITQFLKRARRETPIFRVRQEIKSGGCEPTSFE